MKYLRLVMMLVLSTALLSGCYWYGPGGYGGHRGGGHYNSGGHRR